MQFKYPELLYALFLLLIPIFIHLFQLRKFEKVAFTNVEFLKKIELQTRKSAKLKKFLILLTRLFFIAFLVVAFAQPYFSKQKKGLAQQTIVYLDNSLSMQAKNGSVSLLENAKQQLIKQLNENKINFSLLTNDHFYQNKNKKELKNAILSVNYYPINKTISQQIEKIKYLFEKQKNTKNNMVLISDFQESNIQNLDTAIHYSLVALKVENPKNIILDSVFIANQTSEKIDLSTKITSNKLMDNQQSVSLYDNNRLLGKATVSFKDKTTVKTNFTINKTQNLNGKIITNDNQLQFDNSLYFSLDNPSKINVLVIGKNNQFLSKIYTKDHFKSTSLQPNQIDFNSIKKQNTIVLNELDVIDEALQKILTNFVKNGGSLIIIPSEKISINNYNNFFKDLDIGSITKQTNTDLAITKINFKHPILKGVFEKEITNFQYPSVKTQYKTLLKQASGILKLENQSNFISQIKKNKGTVFWFASPLNTKVTSFKNSPLIVPIFYNIAMQSFQINKLYYLIGNENTIDIQTSLKEDAILKIQEKKHPENNFIPLQQIYNDKVRITLNEFPLKAGYYEIKKDTVTLKTIAFNYSRKESKLDYPNLDYLKKYKNVSLSNSISDTFTRIATENQQQNYWKLFLYIAFLFLLLEMLILKFWKN